MKHTVDIGNYAIKTLLSSREVRKVRSLFCDLQEWDTPKRHDDLSPLVVTDYGRYHFGTKARHYNTCKALVNGDKLEPSIFVPAVLSTLTEQFNGQRVSLTISVPAEYHDTRDLEAALVRKHQFYRNGEPTLVNITNVTKVLEGTGAWSYAKSLGLVKPEGYTVVLDLGGGTVNCLVIAEDGEPVGNPISLDQAGGIALATRIAQDPRFGREVQDYPDTSLILDGIAAGSWRYGQQATFHWGQDHIEPWFAGVKARLRAAIAPHVRNVSGFLVVGGNADLVREYLPDTWVVPELPQEANIRGLALGGVHES